MWHIRTYFHSLINVCDRFLERTKLSRSGAWPGRELFISRLGLGAHGGANGLVPLLPASMCEPDKAIRIALVERHAEKCAMRKTLSGEKLCRSRSSMTVAAAMSQMLADNIFDIALRSELQNSSFCLVTVL